MNCKGRVTHHNGTQPIAHATVAQLDNQGNEIASKQTGDDGSFQFTAVAAGDYTLRCNHFGRQLDQPVHMVQGQDKNDANFDCAHLDLRFSLLDANLNPLKTAPADGQRLVLSAECNLKNLVDSIHWTVQPGVRGVTPANDPYAYEIAIPIGARMLSVQLTAIENVAAGKPAHAKVLEDIATLPADQQRVELREPVGVRLHRTASDPTLDQALWVAIRNRTRAISFERYHEFMINALCWDERSPKSSIQEKAAKGLGGDLGIRLHGVDAYQTLKHLTETFLILECGVRIRKDNVPFDQRRKVPFDPEEESRRLGRPFSPEEMERRLADYLGHPPVLPYISRVVREAFPELLHNGNCEDRLIANAINEPCLIELIWSYWMEEGMLVQTMNAVCQRFQNVRNGDRDPLANLEIDPLRPLSNLLWGYIQDEFNRLTVRRRAYEYVHHYGLTLFGKATAGMHTADSRSKFLEAFHNLLYQTSVFFKEDFQTTVIADGFPLLNALREVHMILAQGAHNQFRDLPWTARVEMMLMQFMMARREIHDFLQARAMVPYREKWEAQVDAMKNLQGWNDGTVSNFRDLAVYGEQLLLSIRYGDWIADNDEYSAINWARYFRPEIQGYLHAYRAVTGIDLTNSERIDATIPGIHLQRRAVLQRARQ